MAAPQQQKDQPGREAWWGGQISRQPGTYSHDGKLVLAPCGSSVLVYSSSTGESVGSLDGHAAAVTCVLLNPSVPGQVYTASRDGSVRLWDVEQEACVREYHMQGPVYSMVIHASLHLAYLSIQHGDAGRVISVRLDTGQLAQTILKTRVPGPLVMNSRGTLVATIDKQSLFVWRAAPVASQPLNLHHTKAYTCLALSSDDSIIAAGDESGRIQVWRDVMAEVPQVARKGAHAGKARPSAPLPSTTVHWHASPVGCLSFSPDGVYLLSGGAEQVLVMWQLEGSKPKFLPRLGAPLCGLHYSPVDPALVLVRQSDNTLRILNVATLRVQTSIIGVKPRPVSALVSAAAAGSTAALHPTRGHLVLPAAGTQLQVYDPAQHRHVSMVQIVPRNQVQEPQAKRRPGGRERSLPPPPDPIVTHLAYSSSGRCMATVDYRPNAGYAEASLKFWDEVDATTKQGRHVPYALNTRVDEPHRGPVSALVFHPTQDVALTLGPVQGPSGDSAYPQGQGQAAPTPSQQGGDEFKVWERVSAPRKPGSEVESPTCWRCRAVGTYKNLPLHTGAFSPDGSLLAISAGNKVTLWDPESCALVGVLSPPVGLHPSESAVTRLVFSSRSPHLIGTTPRAVIVWDLLTSSVEWALPLHTSALVADPASSLFVVAVPAPRPPQQQQQQQQLSSRGRPKQQHHSRAGGAAAAGVAAAGQQQAGEQQGQEPEQEQSRSQQQEESKQGHKAAAAGQEGQRSSIVLAFTPSSAKPVLGTHISGTITPGLLFTAPGMPQYAAQVHAGGKDSASVTMSSLLVLREDRSYTYLGAVSPAAATKAGASQEQQQQQQQQEPQSRFEAAFGPAVAVSSAAQRAAEAGAGTAHDTLTRTQALFDAPSHVLPAPASLAQLYLQVLVGSAAS